MQMQMKLFIRNLKLLNETIYSADAELKYKTSSSNVFYSGFELYNMEHNFKIILLGYEGNQQKQ